jgi:hypothetical protein
MDSIINNFNLTVSTVNGSGSATANNTLLRALFRMGIPVSERYFFRLISRDNLHGSQSVSIKKDIWRGKKKMIL